MQTVNTKAITQSGVNISSPSRVTVAALAMVVLMLIHLRMNFVQVILVKVEFLESLGHLDVTS